MYLLLLLLFLLCGGSDTAADLCGTICCSTSSTRQILTQFVASFWVCLSPVSVTRVQMPFNRWTCLICILKVCLAVASRAEIGAKGKRISLQRFHHLHTHTHTQTVITALPDSSYFWPALRSLIGQTPTATVSLGARGVSIFGVLEGGGEVPCVLDRR